MIQNIQKVLLLGCFSLLITIALLGQEKVHPTMENGKEIFIETKILSSTSLIGESFMVVDDKLGRDEWGTIESTFQVTNQVVLELAVEDAPIDVSSATYDVELIVELWEADNPNPRIEEFILSVTYDSDTKNHRIEKSFEQFESTEDFGDAHSMKISLKNHNITHSDVQLQLYGVIKVHRCYEFDPMTVPVFTEPNIENDQTLALNWEAINGAQEYDVEWSFYRQESEVARAIEATTNTNENNDNENDNDADMGFLYKHNATRVTVDATNCTYPINLIYPEGYLFYRVRGVKYDVDGYRIYTYWSSVFDGFLADYPDKAKIDWHQTGLYNFQSSVAFAEEGKNVPSSQYFDGTLRQRQSVVRSNSDERVTVSQTLYDHHGRPAVTIMPAPAEDDRLELKPLFAAKDGNTAFTKNDFDLEDCHFEAVPLSTAAGAGKYYSTNNSLKDQNEHQYIPDAEGYAYSITEYTPDLTGRIRRQSGVGETFKLGGGRETKYYYGKPTQKELDRLFGNEVGDLSHYLKNAIVDPNEQVSISYIDAHGRTIATSLAGTKPNNVTQLDKGYTEPFEYDVNLLDNKKDGDFSLTSSHKLIVPTISNHTIKYGLNEQTYTKICEATDYCYECLYDLEIRVTDGGCNDFNEGAPLIIPLSNFSLSDLLLGCDDGRDRALKTDFTLENLPIGEYTITKKLSISEAALEKITAHFTEVNECTPTLETIKNSFENQVDISGCQIDCSTSIEGPCKQYTECEINYKNMLADVSPSGQYASYEGDIYNIIANDPTSIFFENQYQQVPGTSYLDEDGNPIMVRDINGQEVSPFQLPPGEFISAWDSEWAEVLVEYFHPEYCLYQKTCDGAEEEQLWDLRLEQKEYYEEGFNNLLEIDPYFTNRPLEKERANSLSEDLPSGEFSEDIWGFASTVIKENYDKEITIETGTKSEQHILWRIYRDTYLSIKKEVQLESRKQLAEEDCACQPDCACLPEIKQTTCDFFDEIRVNGGTADSAKVLRFPISIFSLLPPIPPLTTEEEGMSAMEDQIDVIETGCAAQCEIDVNVWLRQLGPCKIENLSADQLEELKNRLIAVCQSGCDKEHPFGASTPKPSSNLEDSFVQIVKDFFPEANTPGNDCHPYLITALNPHSIPNTHHEENNSPYSYYGPKVIQTLSEDDCVCEQLLSLESCYDPSDDTYSDLADYLSTFGEFSLSLDQIEQLKSDCVIASASPSGAVTFLSEPIQIPTYLECEGCYPCEVIVPLIEDIAESYTTSSLGCNLRTTEHGLESNNIRRTYQSNGTIYAATLGGVAISTDGGQTFENRTNGLASNFIFDILVEGNTIYASTTDGVSISTNGGQSFSSSSLGLSLTFIYGIAVSNTTIFVGTGSGLFVSTNGGIFYTYRKIDEFSGNERIKDVLYQDGILYVTTYAGVFISTDEGQTFTQSLGSELNQINKIGEVLYAGSVRGGLYISTDGGRTFDQFTIANGLGSNYVSEAYEYEGVIYAATEEGLFSSTDNGNTFEEITFNEASLGAVNGVFVADGILYASTSNGLFICDLSSSSSIEPFSTEFFEVATHQLNYELGFSFEADRYQEFHKNCQDDTKCSEGQILCRDYANIEEPAITQEESCIEELYQQAEINAIELYEQLQRGAQIQLQQEYITTCLNNLEEVFTATTINHEYHYTLYYYDQAGNLVQTVPPNGVEPLSQEELVKVQGYRKGTEDNPTYPDHTFLTQYSYNSINQVISQTSPDTEEKKFWYDQLGRLVLSQDGRQAPKSLYSYTIYDKLGRIVEVGEKESPLLPEDMSEKAYSNSYEGATNTFIDWINENNRSSLSQITHTYYDDAAFTIPAFDNESQDELRTRVATVTFEENADGNLSTYDYASHYSYDVTGNVKTLIQEITDLHDINQGYKRIDYDYDYISGNVHAVYYQRGKPDQFTHRYEYDDNNRLIEVESSLVETEAGGMLWDREAVYEYYLHGPLARVEIGDDGVQGCDYAYTLQGWIKGVNSNGLVAEKDMGQDGSTSENGGGENPNQTVARDALGYTLSYFEGDYQSISGNSFEMGTLGSAIEVNNSSLYNGNIRHMVIHNKALGDPIAYNYTYDQLHRIKEMTSVENSFPDVFAWGSAGSNLSNFGMRAWYDGNGNIDSLVREGIPIDKMESDVNKSEVINDIDYEYEEYTNKLISTIDATGECELESEIDHPVTTSQTISSIESISVSSSIAGSETVELQTRRLICLEPGFKLEGTGGHFAAITGMPCDEEDLSTKTGTYQYDGNGNMIKNGEDVTITWTPYGKVKTVTPPDDSDLPTTTFGYDAAQNRILKEVATAEGITQTYYIRDAQGNMLATYKVEKDIFHWEEQHLYGSSRLGILSLQEEITAAANEPQFTAKGQLLRGLKRYELSNHLGNVLAVVNDRKQAIRQSSSNELVDYYEPTIVSATDYYPFGLEMAGRMMTDDSYRFGFNGKEKDSDGEWGNSTHYDYGFRIYDPTIARFLSVDPLADAYTGWSPYNYVMGNPINNIDPDGRSVASTHTDKDGNVIAVYDDGDSGIYRHSNVEAGTHSDGAKALVDQMIEHTNSTSGGGEYMGKSLHTFSFTDFGALENGQIIPRGHIDFESTWAMRQVNGIMWNMAGKAIGHYALNAGQTEKYDIKHKALIDNGSVYYLSLIHI